MSRTPRAMKKAARERADRRPRCGLCGKTDNLTKTECCDQRICGDEDSLIAESRTKEPRKSLASVRSRLERGARLDGCVEPC